MQSALTQFVTPGDVPGLLPGFGGRPVSMRTIRTWIASGKLPTRRLGRRLLISVADVAALIEAPPKDPLPVAIRSRAALLVLQKKYGF